MFCPKCSAANPEGQRYCTRCGTNLGVVSDALSGKFEVATPAANTERRNDERLVPLLKDYYRGRQMTLLGFILSALMIFKLAVSLFFGMMENYLPLIIALAVFFILGIGWFIWGTMKWSSASSELKALGYDKAANALPKPKQNVESLPEGSVVMTVKDYATDALPSAPPSVTEQTTRFLEEEVDEKDARFTPPPQVRE